MGAPTWTDEDTKAVLEESGLEPADAGLEADEQVERALLAHFLFSDPRIVLAKTGRETGLPLRRITKRYSAWLRMISGHDFVLGHADPPSTDGENLFLPKSVPAPPLPEQDETLYRAMGLVQLGLFKLGFLEQRATLTHIYKDWVLRSIYHLLAGRYVIRHWRERFPGIAEDFDRVQVMDKAGTFRVNVSEVPRDGLPKPFLPLYQGLTVCLTWPEPGAEGALAQAAVDAVDQAASPAAARLAILGHAQTLRQEYRRLRLGPPPLPYYLGVIRPEWILADLDRDVAYEEEWKQGNAPLRALRAAMERNRGRIPVPEVNPEGPKPRGLRGRLKARLGMGDVAPRADKIDVRSMPAYGKLRDEAFEAAEASDHPDQSPAKPSEDGGREYDEWDHEGGFYKIAETRVFTPEGLSGSIAGYEKVVQANQRQIALIRKRFEALRVEERWMGGLPDGPEIDIDRAIIAWSDIVAGQQPKEDYYRRFVRRKQDICVMTLVDLSGSTQGRILSLQQEAVVLFAEGLRTLGVAHSFYGFNSTHPQQVNLHRLKGFDERYDESVFKRLGNLRAQGATRLGAIIRHAAFMLDQRPEGRRILILLSDGKPEDRGEYRGSYGVKDTAMAVQEASRVGVHTHCISMDDREDAREYLGEIFGPGRYLLLSQVDMLPVRLPEVFRGLVF